MKQVKPEVKPDVRVEPKLEAKVESKPEVKDIRPEVKPEPLTGEEDSAQIAKKIKGLLGLKKKPEEQQEPPASEAETVKVDTVRSEPPSSVSGK